MHHISGLIYDGLWVNGFPEIMATKLKISFDNNSEIDKKKKSPKDKTKVSIFQGIGFTVSVECLNESNRVILGSVSCVCIGGEELREGSKSKSFKVHLQVALYCL